MERIEEKHIDLKDKVEAFLRWYYENRYAYTTIRVFEAEVDNISKLLEKTAEWFENLCKNGEPVDKEKAEGEMRKFAESLTEQERSYLSCNSVKDFELNEALQEELYKAIMYRIIDRGGSTLGPKRGFEFAKSFTLDTRIPMMYGLELTDPSFIRLYYDFKAVNEDSSFSCYVNYFSTENKEECSEYPFSELDVLMSSPAASLTTSSEEMQNYIRENVEQRLNENKVMR